MGTVNQKRKEAMKEQGLSLSQKAIADTEQVFWGGAQNTISLKLHLPEGSSMSVKEAADTALDSADIFTASLRRGKSEWTLVYGDKKKSGCSITEERLYDRAREYMDASDRLSMDIDRRLYEAEVIPLLGGGVFLYVRFHHLIIDGYGMSLFVQRVLDILAGKEIEKSVFDADSARGEAVEEDFWRRYFSDAEFEPSVFPEKSDESNMCKSVVSVPGALMEKITSFSEREHCSVPYILAAAYALYLSEATDKKDAVFLMPRLNRRPEQMDILGCYTLLVPVRVTVTQEDTFLELCKKTERAAREASAHKRVGYDRILSALRDENMISEALSEYVFNFYRFRYQTDLKYNVSFSVAGDMKNHMTLTAVYNEKGGLSLLLDYCGGVYTKEKAEDFSKALFQILSDGMENRTVSEIQSIGDAEYEKAASVKGPSFEIGTELTIPSMLKCAAKQYAEKPALYAGNKKLTFQELDELSDRIAGGLIRQGIKSGDYVAFMLKRDERLIPTIFGISKAGAAFIPVDPAYPPDRISYIMENSRAVCLISSSDVRMSNYYSYLEINDLTMQKAEPGLLPVVRQDHPAYMIYTSGTTGRPKGVMLSHKGIANIVHPDNNPFNRDITKNCKGITAIGSVCFDIFLYEIFVPLMNGLFVELGNEKAMMDAGELAEHIMRHGADILHCTPSRITAYLNNPAFTKALLNVGAILSAGEVLPGSLVRRLKDTYQIRIYNGYGPTETTIGATITEANDAQTIGKPIANMGIVLLNRERKPVPYGAVGEICIHGNGVGIGYKDRPKETEDKYIMWNGLRLYRTGDLGFFTEDGRLKYRGRNDRQVKLRGLRIELSEIENVMGEFPNIAACCCMVRKIEKTDHLVGFYTVSDQEKVDAEELKAFMKSRLTSYMVPDVLKELKEMPQTPNGKTDLKALGAESIEYVRVYREANTKKEKIVCKIFGEILGVPQIGLDDNFFELGGDSLSAVTVMLRLEEELGLSENQLEYGDFYKYPTPSLLLEKLYKKEKDVVGFHLKMLDYHGFNEYLAAHTGKSVGRVSLGNVLLTGATGYLGIHLLIELLKRPGICNKIVCLARSKKKNSAERRVKAALFYYAEEDFSQSYGEKWTVMEGDITNPDLFSESCPHKINTIINSAANVAHFSYGTALEEINTDGVRNLIRFAEKENAALCQVSTISVAGMTDGKAEKETFGEGDFYIGQEISNRYIYSKYMAEYEMLRAAVDRGLKIKIMRVGNLQGRIRDGEFQMNLRSNAFTRRLSSYVKIGAVPASVYNGSVNFSPVDETAHNIVSLAATGDEAAAFHVYPPLEVKFADLFEGIRKLGYSIDVLSDQAFQELLQKLRRTEAGREQMEGLFTDETERTRREIVVTQEETNRYIQELSEGWSMITEDYLDKYLSALDGMYLF